MKYKSRIPNIQCDALEISSFMAYNLQVIMIAYIEFMEKVRVNDKDLHNQAIWICEKYGLPTDILKRYT